MTDKAKIREALELVYNRAVDWVETYSNWFNPVQKVRAEKREAAIDEALALLDAERPSVPMAMIDDFLINSGCLNYEEYREKMCTIANLHGFDVKE